MKKMTIALALSITTLVTSSSQAFLGGGGFSGPMPVYNVDKTVDAAALATKINTAQQLEAMLKNFSTMDSSTAAANRQLINDTINQLIALQTEMNLDMSQAAYDGKYVDVSYMTTEEQAAYIEGLQRDQSVTLQNAMETQGLVTSQNSSISASMNRLLNESQSSEGALAAAQVAHELAALQLTQMMQMQEMIARSNRLEAERIAIEKEKEKVAYDTSRRVLGL